MEQDVDKIEREIAELQGEITKQVNDAVSHVTTATKGLVSALQASRRQQDEIIMRITMHKRANLSIIEERSKEAEEGVRKKQRVAECSIVKLSELQQRMEEEADKAEQMVKLNVGGQMFTTSKTTLLSQPDTYFTAMLGSGRWKPQPDGSYFIDRNPKYFEIILEYLRTDILAVEELSHERLRLLYHEMDYFQIPISGFMQQILEPPPAMKQVGSLILQLHAGGMKILTSWLPDKQKIGPLLFRASEGCKFSAERFHEVCDGQAPLLIIAQTTARDICGGYAASPFSSPLPWKYTRTASEKSWIFTLVNQFDVPPTRFYPHDPEAAQANRTDWGPAFGVSADFSLGRITNPDLLLGSALSDWPFASTCFPQAYKDTTGKGKALFCPGTDTLSNSVASSPLTLLEVLQIRPEEQRP